VARDRAYTTKEIQEMLMKSDERMTRKSPKPDIEKYGLKPQGKI